MKSYFGILVGLLALLLFSSCSITKNVRSVPAGKTIDTIYVQWNPDVFMDGLHPEIVQELRDQGFQARTYQGTAPKEAVYILTYTANWRWHYAMYLTYFRATLTEHGSVLGQVEYNAKFGRLRPDKYGKTADKIRPLLTELLNKAQHAPTPAPALGANP